MTLSTHVLDMMHGRPAAGMALSLWQDQVKLFDGVTDGDGRCLGLSDLTLEKGRYRLVFKVADYFRMQGVALPEPPFLDAVPIDFGIADEGHYHVPLLASPFAYSTYRGS